jgi:hypothetical protein
MTQLELHEVTRISGNRFAYLESNHALARRTPEAIIQEATPNIPDHAITLGPVEQGLTHSTILFWIDL